MVYLQALPLLTILLLHIYFYIVKLDFSDNRDEQSESIANAGRLLIFMISFRNR